MNKIQTLASLNNTMNQNIWEKHAWWRKTSSQNDYNLEKTKHRMKISPYFYFGLLKRGQRINFIIVHKYFHEGGRTVEVLLSRQSIQSI